LIEIQPRSASPLDESFSAWKISPRLPALTRHEIVQARVIHPYADHEAVIAIKERNLIARTHVPLEKGQLLLLKVEQTSPTPLLRLLGVTGRSTGPSILLQAVEQNLWRQVLETLTKPTTPTEEQGGLRELLKDLSSFFAKSRGRQSLMEWVEKSGLAWENKLRQAFAQGRQSAEDLNRLASGDLKGALARLMNKEEGCSPLIGRLLNVIESLQWLNFGSVNQTGNLLFLIPCQFSGGFWTVVQVLIQKEQDETHKDRGKGRSCRVVLSAQLESLGYVRAELAMEDKEVKVAFLLESAQSRSRLQAHLPDLINSLQDRGFHVREARCEVGEKDVVRQSLVHDLADLGAHSFSTFV
jgi:hypothetical protein